MNKALWDQTHMWDFLPKTVVYMTTLFLLTVLNMVFNILKKIK